MTWWNSDWTYRKEVVIQNGKVADNHSNFPILVSEIDNDLKIHIAQANAEDTAFVDTDDSTQLDHEIEKWDSSDGTLIAHLRIPTMDKDSNKTIYVYYGNAGCANQQNITGVWDDNYKMVQHMKDDPDTSSITDSTQYDNDGAKKGANEPIEADAKIAKGQSFDGTNDEVRISDFWNPIQSNFTLEAWIKTTVSGRSIYAKQANSPGFNGFNFFVASGGLQVVVCWNNAGQYGNIIGNTEINTGTWKYVVFVFTGADRTNWKIYVDGAQDTFTEYGQDLIGDGIDTAVDFRIGNREQGASFFKGLEDEVRISNTARSTDWITTSFNTQNDPSSFYTLGDEESEEAPSATILPLLREKI